MTSSVSFAILAPVPEEHLKSGLDVVAAEEFVAYGSRKWEFFREVDSLRGDEHVPVLIYPSYEDAVGSIYSAQLIPLDFKSLPADLTPNFSQGKTR